MLNFFFLAITINGKPHTVELFDLPVEKIKCIEACFGRNWITEPQVLSETRRPAESNVRVAQAAYTFPMSVIWGIRLLCRM